MQNTSRVRKLKGLIVICHVGNILSIEFLKRHRGFDVEMNTCVQAKFEFNL